MYTNRKKFNAGFTLVETLIALTLGAIISLMIVITVTNGLMNIRNASEMERLHSDATFIANILTYWIKQSVEIEVPDNTTLNLIMYNASTTSFELNGVNLGMALDEGTPARINTEDSKVENITFTKLAKSVRISFVLKAPNAELRLSATSTIAQRN